MTVTPIQIRFSDTDMLGHINNSKYSQFFDIGRLEYLNKVFGDLTDWKGKTLVVVRVETDFIQPTFLNDSIRVQTQIVEVGNRSVKMLQQIVDDKGNVKVKSSSVMSAFNTQANQSFVIPDEWRDRITRFEEQTKE